MLTLRMLVASTYLCDLALVTLLARVFEVRNLVNHLALVFGVLFAKKNVTFRSS